MFIQLIGVYQIVPDGVETAGGGADGRQEGVAQPDGEDGVFLPQSLSAFQSASVVLSDSLSQPELQQASCKRNSGNTKHLGNADAAVVKCSYGNSYRQ